MTGKLLFKYTDFNAKKRQVLRNSGEPYILSPYSLIRNGDYYYVVGFSHTRDHTEAFRVDRIKSTPKILDEKAQKMPKDFDISEHASEVIRMYDTEGKTVSVTLLCKNELIKYVIDQFGMNVDTRPVDEDHFEAKVQVCASSTFYAWVFGWCNGMQIMDPPEVKAEYQKMLEEAQKGIRV